MLLKLKSNSIVYLIWHMLIFWNIPIFLRCPIFLTNMRTNLVQNWNNWCPFAICMHILKWGLKIKEQQGLNIKELFCRVFFVPFCLRKVYLWWPRRGLSFFKRKTGKDLSPHIIKSLVIEDTHEKKIWELGPHMGQMLHFSLVIESWPLRILVTWILPLG